MFEGMGKRTVVAAAAIAVLVGAVAVSPTLGGPSFLTSKKAKKRFITKKAANNKFAAKTNVYTKSESDGKFLPSNGDIRVGVPWAGWVDEDGTANAPTFFGNVAQLTGGANSFFSLPIELPVNLLGKPVTLVGVELCYEVIPGGTLDLVNVNRATPTAADSTPSVDTVAADDTDRTDATCRTYAPASPVALGANDVLQLQLRNDVAAGSVDVSRTTVIVRI